jgi:hypothetical protein
MRVQGQPLRWLEAVRLSPGANCDAMRDHVTHSHLRPLTGSTSSGTRVTRVNTTGGARKRTSCFQHQRRRGGEDAGAAAASPPSHTRGLTRESAGVIHHHQDLPQNKTGSGGGYRTGTRFKFQLSRDEANLPPGALCAGECCRSANASHRRQPQTMAVHRPLTAVSRKRWQGGGRG